MKLEKYKEYKASGVEWLGNIPKDWEIKRIKDLCRMQSGFYINANDFVQEGYSIYGGNGFRGYSDDYNHNGKYILIGRQGALCGNINYAKGKFWATEHAIVVYEKKDVNQFWYGELLRIMDLNQYSQSAAQPGLSVERISRLTLPFPPLKTQTAIANYLDQKTLAIDKKVKLLEQKVLKYKELRKSIINQAVTKGVKMVNGKLLMVNEGNDIKLKDSGISWIGKIPEHWEVKRIKDYFYNSMGNTILKEDLINNGKIPVYSATQEDVFFGYVNRANKLLKCNDIVIPARGNSIGFVKLVKTKSTTTQTTIASIKKRKINSKYIFYFLQGYKRVIFKFDNTAIPQFTVEDADSIVILIPSTKEQTQIAEYLDDQTSIIDNIVVNIEKQINVLKELRKTLINDVVTGKIKVNDEK